MRILDTSKLYDMSKDELIELIIAYDKFKTDMEYKEALQFIRESISKIKEV